MNSNRNNQEAFEKNEQFENTSEDAVLNNNLSFLLSESFIASFNKEISEIEKNQELIARKEEEKKNLINLAEGIVKKRKKVAEQIEQKPPKKIRISKSLTNLLAEISPSIPAPFENFPIQGSQQTLRQKALIDQVKTLNLTKRIKEDTSLLPILSWPLQQQELINANGYFKTYRNSEIEFLKTRYQERHKMGIITINPDPNDFEFFIIQLDVNTYLQWLILKNEPETEETQLILSWPPTREEVINANGFLKVEKHPFLARILHQNALRSELGIISILSNSNCHDLQVNVEKFSSLCADGTLQNLIRKFERRVFPNSELNSEQNVPTPTYSPSFNFFNTSNSNLETSSFLELSPNTLRLFDSTIVELSQDKESSEGLNQLAK